MTQESDMRLSVRRCLSSFSEAAAPISEIEFNVAPMLRRKRNKSLQKERQREFTAMAAEKILVVVSGRVSYYVLVPEYWLSKAEQKGKSS